MINSLVSGSASRALAVRVERKGTSNTEKACRAVYERCVDPFHLLFLATAELYPASCYVKSIECFF